MKRRLTNLAAAVSLLLCVALLCAWVRSAFRSENVEGTVGGVKPPLLYLSVVSSNGGVALAYMPRCPESYRWDWHSADVGAFDRRWLGTGFRARWQKMQFPPQNNSGKSVSADYLFVELPYWSLVALTAVLPGFVLFVRRRMRRIRRRRERGLCPSCGYDLRASTDRCPECGAPARQP